MTDQQFCKLESSYSGEDIDQVEQVTYVNLTGREMKEFLEFAIEQHEFPEVAIYKAKMEHRNKEINSWGCSFVIAFAVIFLLWVIISILLNLFQ